ncbi:hypothetical protein SLEP1_g33454 [Rubroshorea leprosula]|uniref:Uncharacterized protein n=1 Tax=Rubroshorea leprosula TaxID=152421 RepID=A0AAV5KGQ9_9ROSI|nr:hypothetical protein SLEP1_g33454 [Rubroshorea leprosula]
MEERKRDMGFCGWFWSHDSEIGRNGKGIARVNQPWRLVPFMFREGYKPGASTIEV